MKGKDRIVYSLRERVETSRGLHVTLAEAPNE